MDIQKIQQYKLAFDLIVKEVKDEDNNRIEVWYARELQQVLGISPAMATIISLPQFRMMSRMRMVKPSGEP